ncbi:Thioredoxin [Thiorhodovibrio winogradskyi]|uniref:Thioredoxin n=1 Tax=Thiorhodovibrio winogradskyi TaxID=77007 RepID=A0ABZ0S8Y9_9GAMM|nr:thioredoxin family protein [Thiorhodovibrio winogradskyi]
MSSQPYDHSDDFSTGLEDFNASVLDASHRTPVLVDFWAAWCSPCHALAPHLLRVLSDYDGRLRLAKVEVDEGENMKLAGRYRVRGFPTVMLFCAGEEQGRFSGARASPQIRDWLAEHLPRCSNQTA